MTERHKFIDVELAHKILDLMETQPAYLDKFEIGIIMDRGAAILEYGTRAVVTYKQLKFINQAISKKRLYERIQKIKEKQNGTSEEQVLPVPPT